MMPKVARPTTVEGIRYQGRRCVGMGINLRGGYLRVGIGYRRAWVILRLDLFIADARIQVAVGQVDGQVDRGVQACADDHDSLYDWIILVQDGVHQRAT